MLVLTWPPHLFFMWTSIYGVPSQCQVPCIAQGYLVKTERSDQAQGIHGVQGLSDRLKVKNETQEDLRANS